MLPMLATVRRFHRREAGLIHNTVALGLIQVAQYSLPLITLPYLIRVLGVQRFGVVSFAIAFVQYFMILTDYGFNLTATRAISIHREDHRQVSRVVSAVLCTRLLFFVASVLLCLGLTAVSPRLQEHRLLILLSLTNVLGSAISLTCFFQGIERMKFITALSLSAKAAYTLSLFFLVHGPGDYRWVPFLSGSTETIAGLLGLVIAIQRFGIRLVLPTSGEILLQLRQGWPVFCSTVAISAYTATRTFAIGMFTTSQITGYYSIAERITSLLQMFPLGPVLAVLYPRLSHLYARAPRATYRLIFRLQRYTVIAYLLATPLIALLLPYAVRLLSKELAPETVLVSRILLVSVFFINSNAFLVQFLLVAGAQSIFARIHAVAGIAGCVLVVWSAWLWSYLGPPVMMTFISLGILLWTRFEIQRFFTRSQRLRQGRVFTPVVLARRAG